MIGIRVRRLGLFALLGAGAALASTAACGSGPDRSGSLAQNEVPPASQPPVNDASTPDTGALASAGAGGAVVDAGSEVDAGPLTGDAGSPLDASADVTVDAGPAQCGDGVINQASEQCDDGTNPPPYALCTATCTVQDQLVVAGGVAPDAGFPNPVSRTLGMGRHPVAGANEAFAVSFVQTAPVTGIYAALFDAHDVRHAPIALTGVGDAGGVPLATAAPVVAALPSGLYGVAFAYLAENLGDETDIALESVGAAGSGVTTTANAQTAGAQYDADAVWTGTDLVVAWTDTSAAATSPDLRMHRFDAQLNPRTTADEDLAVTADAEGDVALASFAGSWAAAWRATTAAGGEYLRTATAGGGSWSVGPYLAGPEDARPALVPVDATHLLVAYIEGRDDDDSGVATSYVARGAILDTTAPSNDGGAVTVTAFDFVDTTGASIPALEVNLAAQNAAIALAWRSPGNPADPTGEDVRVAWWPSVSGPADVQAPVSPIAIPFNAAHRVGDQESIAVAPLSAAPTQLVVAWDDLGQVFGPGEGQGDVVALRLPPLP